MKKFHFYLGIWFLPFFFLSAYIFPILDPHDKQYEWMDRLIDQEFADKKKFSKRQLKQAISYLAVNPWYQHFTVQDNQVIGPDEPCMEFKSLLIHLCETYGLPNIEIICFVHDGLQENPKGVVPVFARCRKKGSDNALLLHYGYGLNWVVDQCNRVEAKIADLPWESLINKVHWRGNTTDGYGKYDNYTSSNWFKHPRGKICQLSQQFPDLIDAAFVLDPIFGLKIQEQKILIEKILPTAPRVAFEDCLNYKYQVLIEGIVSPWSSDWKIHAGRVIFKQTMRWEVFWESLFLPWEHYIPIAEDFSDFVEKMLWAMWNDKECKEMAMRSRAFIQTHAKAEHMALYCYKVLLRYAQLLTHDNL